MWDGLVEVACFASETLARVDLARLEAAGFEAMLAVDNCGGMGPYLDLQLGVRLLVRAADEEAARELLRVPTASAASWTCPACGEQGEPGFAICWRCGRERG